MRRSLTPALLSQLIVHVFTHLYHGMLLARAMRGDQEEINTTYSSHVCVCWGATKAYCMSVDDAAQANCIPNLSRHPRA